MAKSIRPLFAAGVVVCIVIVAASFRAQAGDMSKIERGKYLVTAAGCNDCHSPKVWSPEGIPSPDPKLLLSGHQATEKLPEYQKDWVKPGNWILMSVNFTAFVGPWGVSFAANLTPDDQTGIGLWTEDVFVSALRSGKHMGKGRPILPPMPWPGVAQMSDEDLGAIFAYLKSIPPVKNQVPAPVMAQAPKP
jgi:hypothetical protein